MGMISASGKLNVPPHAELVKMDEETAILSFNDGKLDDGTPYWCYVAVKPSKYGEYRAAIKSRKRIQLQDYGEVVKYGFESSVPGKVRDEMEEKYGFNDDYVASLVEKAENEMTAFNKKKEDNRIGDIVAMMKKKH